MLRVSRVASSGAHVPELAVHRPRALLHCALRAPPVHRDAPRLARDVARIARAGRRDERRSGRHERVCDQVDDDRRGVLPGGDRRPPGARRLRVGCSVRDAEAGGYRVHDLRWRHPPSLRRRDHHLVLHRNPSHQLH